MTDFEKDEQLLLAARQGDDDAMKELIVRINPIVGSIVSSFSALDVERDDLIQEGMLGLLSAIFSYEQGRAASFRTYAHTCIHNRLTSVARRHGSAKRIPENAFVELDDDVIGQSMSDPQEYLDLSDEFDSLLQKTAEVLSPFEGSVFKLYVSGEGYSDIAKSLGTDVKSVDNALQRIRRKLKQ